MAKPAFILLIMQLRRWKLRFGSWNAVCRFVNALIASPSRALSTDTLDSNGVGRRYRAVRAVTASLAAGVSAEDQMVQSCPDASPMKWHQAHTNWFFETFLLCPFLPDYKPLL